MQLPPDDRALFLKEEEMRMELDQGRNPLQPNTSATLMGISESQMQITIKRQQAFLKMIPAERRDILKKEITNMTNVAKSKFANR